MTRLFYCAFHGLHTCNHGNGNRPKSLSSPLLKKQLLMKLTRTALAALLMLITSWASAQDIVVPCEQFTLPNGLNVILHKDNTIPRVTVNVWYHVGSGSEKPGRTGFAHLFEHILF